MEGENIVIILVYVDDLLCATNNEHLKVQLFKDLSDDYGVKDQGILTDYLGVEVEQSNEKIAIHQGKYTRLILDKYGYADANKVGNPMETNTHLVAASSDEELEKNFDYRGALGMLMYLATSTRPDIAYAVGQLSRFAAAPTVKHVGTIKRVMRYLAGTVEQGIVYSRQQKTSDSIDLQGYCDSDWAGDAETRKSTTGFVFTLAGGAVSWMSRRQTIIALSTAEAEYVAACEAAMEATGEANILKEINVKIGIDNQSAHVMATSPTFSRRTRHIELRWHYVREQVQRGTIQLMKIVGSANPADAFTKPLNKNRIKMLNELMGVGAAGRL
ncbi:hypothetical protein P43SY_011673 [Pythium insidiosum]|uniref:Reverse transcriptase Ty1/copia-type domain-containing protein n=1 Tax=Pythium insidiosum TaxID=114742 RepID=A0AAD5LSD5_PYTIN|nr:hypothetical protein P43SY_011673 [Pythium insidiosum]